MSSSARVRDQAGFTLIELITVVLIIGILAAIALPAFIAQRVKAQDGSAKSDARTLLSAMEACHTEQDLYDPCPDEPPGPALGTLGGQVSATPSGDTYLLVAYSNSGNTFTLTKNPDSTVTRTCSDAGSPDGGCDGGVW